MNVRVSAARPHLPEVEVVERKGLGHPDSICDSLAEQLSLALCAFYRDRFDLILHHNVDKVMLCAGEAKPSFGGGKLVRPIDIFFAGRAVLEFKGVAVPVEDLARETTHVWFRRRFHALDPARDVRVHVFVRPGSQDLTELYERQAQSRIWLANDTSCGVGFAPLSPVEKLTLDLEHSLNSPETRKTHPEVGQDVKVMSVRDGQQLHLTIACAFIDRYLDDVDDYRAKKTATAQFASRMAEEQVDLETKVAVNTADNPRAGSVYLTVTGTSAEAGDDGEAGRGNRANGLITPCRPMTMESVAGKNPVTHVGKLYNLAAGLVAQRLVDEIPEVREATCLLVSQIGRPVAEPLIVDLKATVAEPAALPDHKRLIESIVREELQALQSLAQTLLAGEVAFDDWPLRRKAASKAVSAKVLRDL